MATARIDMTKNFGVLSERAGIPRLFLREIGDWIVDTIDRRTRAGRDYEGRPFRALSPAYAKLKQKGIGSTRADLTVSGRMLNDMQAKVVSDDTVEVRFVSQGGSSRGSGTFIQRSRAVGAADKAYYHHKVGAGKSRVKREFFDLSTNERRYISRAVGKMIAQQLRKG